MDSKPVKTKHLPAIVRAELRRIRMQPIRHKCYRNSQKFLLETRLDVAYHEGWVETVAGLFQHGWLTYEGEVLDLTLLPERQAKYGPSRTFDEMAIKEAIRERGLYGPLSNLLELMMPPGITMGAEGPIGTMTTFQRVDDPTERQKIETHKATLQGQYREEKDAAKRAVLLTEIEACNQKLQSRVEACIERDGCYVMSDGTLRKQDLLPKALETLQEMSPEAYAKVLGTTEVPRDDRDSWWETDEPLELLMLVEDALSEAAPEGYWFGSQEGDGACFGFWKLGE